MVGSQRLRILGQDLAASQAEHVHARHEYLILGRCGIIRALRQLNLEQLTGFFAHLTEFVGSCRSVTHAACIEVTKLVGIRDRNPVDTLNVGAVPLMILEAILIEAGTT